MPIQSPLSVIEGFLQSLPLPDAPPWLVEEGQRRIVLLLNHVLMQEPQAMQRLVRQKGRVVLAQWRHFTFKISVTPAGLLDLAAPAAVADLTLVVTEESALVLAQKLLQGGKPLMRVEGDIQLAAELNWLASHVRWDIEEDLARIIGDANAHLLADCARSAVQACATFVRSRQSSSTATDAAAAATNTTNSASRVDTAHP